MYTCTCTCVCTKKSIIHAQCVLQDSRLATQYTIIIDHHIVLSAGWVPVCHQSMLQEIRQVSRTLVLNEALLFDVYNICYKFLVYTAWCVSVYHFRRVV